MKLQTRQQPDSLHWAESFAGHIHDPVSRLRFLRAVVRISETGEIRRRVPRRYALIALLLVLLCGGSVLFRMFAVPRELTAHAPAAVPEARAAVRPAKGGAPDVWQVEKTADAETYSNGLRIDDRFTVSNRPRGYLAFPAGPAPAPRGVPHTEPAGIVFHTTQSHQVPFQPRENGALKRIAESLLEYVRGERAYHFVIDRFGRVYRVVRESDAAHHAGYSVWADDRWLYINLNESFLAVAFEAETQPGQVDASISPAQVRSAAALTEILRGRYGIPAGNCITHAQVSVNPSNMRIGYHTDWASSFPFEQLGLPDNYSQALPALARFGFEYDPSFLREGGARMYRGIELAERDLEARAAASRVPVAARRRMLQAGYREMLAKIRRCSTSTAQSQ
jgi:hypothetical protein